MEVLFGKFRYYKLRTFSNRIIDTKIRDNSNSFEWRDYLKLAGSDVDGDLDYFKLYLDKTDASTFIKQIDAISTNTETAIEVEAETAYSWKIIAVDSNGNKSDSGIYTFRTD